MSTEEAVETVVEQPDPPVAGPSGVRGAASSDGPLTFPAVARLELDDLLTQLVERASDVMRTRDRMRGLLEATRAVASDLALPVLLERIVEVARTLVDARYAALGVIGNDDELAQFIHSGMDEDAVAVIGHLPHGLGLLGELIRHPHPLRLEDLTRHPASVGFPPGHPPMTSFIGVPLQTRDRVFGNLYLTDKVSGEPFTAEDEELIVSLAAAAATAIDNARMFETVSRREHWLQASRNITNAMLDVPDQTEALRQVACGLRSAAGSDVAAVVVVEGRTLRVAAIEGGPDGMTDLTVPAEGTVTTAALEQGRPVLLGDVRDEPYSPALNAQLNLGPMLVVPLVRNGMRGALLLGNRPGGRRFSADDVGLVVDFADQAALVLDVGESRAAERRAQLFEDRARIARDLHDQVIQRLFAIGLTLQALSSEVPASAGQELLGQVDELDTTIREIRTAVFALSRQETDAPTLRSSILDLVTEYERPLGFTPRVTLGGPLDSIVQERIATDVLATLREALSNAARHAHASDVAVTVLVGETLSLTVADNGCGISDTGRRSGLANMGARAEGHGGTCTITRGDPAGTVVRWEVPLP